MMACCTKRRGCLGLFVLGLVAFILSFVMSWYIMKELREGIAANAKLPTEADFHAKNDVWNQWEDTINSEDPRKYWYVYFYNWTNMEQFLSTEGEVVPTVEEVGPYAYIEYQGRFDTKWNSDSSLLTYNERTYYTFAPEKNCAHCSYDDVITSVWPAQVVAFLQAAEATPAGQSPYPFLLGGLVPKLAQAGFGVWDFYCSAMNHSAFVCGLEAIGQWSKLSANGGKSIVQTPEKLEFLMGSSNETYRSLAVVLTQLYEDAGLYPEIEAFAKFHAKTNVTIPETSFLPLTSNPNCSIFTSNDCLNTFLAGEPAPAEWKLDKPQSDLLRDYLTVTTEAFLQLGNRRTTGSWLFSFTDPIALLTGAASNNTAYFPSNYSSNEDMKELNAALCSEVGCYQQRTGAGDVSMARAWTKYNGVHVIPQKNASDMSEAWCHETLTVSGYDVSQYKPGTTKIFGPEDGVSKSDKLATWVDDILQEAALDFSFDNSVKGIDTYGFEISKAALAPNPNRSMEYQGLVNMTCPENAPIFITEPHWLKADVPAAWHVNGQTPAVPSLHQTLISVEPLTGATLEGIKRLQINVQMQFQGVHGNKTYIMPALWVEEHLTLTDKQAKKFKDKLEFAVKLRKQLFLGLLIGGILLSCVSLIALWRLKDDSADGYGTVGTTQYGRDALLESEEAF